MVVRQGLQSKRRIYHLFILLPIVLVLSNCGNLVHHQVRKGDTLYSIGFYYGHDYRDIAKWNDISEPFVIKQGQWLRVAPPDKFNHRREQNSKSVVGNNGKKTVASIRETPVVHRKDVSGNHFKQQDISEKSTPVRAWKWPTVGKLKDPDKKFSERNKGIDILGRQGNPIYATAAGKVVYSGSGLIGFGKLIIIKHNKTYLSAYAHNERMLVKEGDVVNQGQKIALMGRTNDNQALLHFEIRRNGAPIDPLRLLARRSH